MTTLTLQPAMLAAFGSYVFLGVALFGPYLLARLFLRRLLCLCGRLNSLLRLGVANRICRYNYHHTALASLIGVLIMVGIFLGVYLIIYIAAQGGNGLKGTCSAPLPLCSLLKLFKML